MSDVEFLLEDARKRLVETGTRNRLIHVNRKSSRGNWLDIINERSDDVFQILCLNARKMKFVGKGSDQELDSEGLIFEELHVERFDEARYTDLVLETPLSPDALQKRLIKLAGASRTAEQEQGINVLFLAMGFLQWFEDGKSDVLREAPLVLLPVMLVRNNKTSTYDLQCRDDDIVVNLSLQERLKLDFGISLPEIDDASDWRPTDYFAAVEEAISGKERWRIDADGMQLGLFSFAKLMMLRDLDPENWGANSLLSNNLLKGILSEGFEPIPPLFEDNEKLDDKLAPTQILHVVDADTSQTKVIEEVRAGRNLVVQGPPGTGKSQVITNILAAAAHDGKTVLFVAEKMAALEVVYNRMCKVGLKDLCLELHSRRANKKNFLQGLAETIAQSHGVTTQIVDTTDLTVARDQLNRIVDVLHSSLPERDYSPFQVLSELAYFVHKIGDAPKFDAARLERLSVQELAGLYESLTAYLHVIEQHGAAADNPFSGATNLDLQPTDIQRLENDLRGGIKGLTQWTTYQRSIEEALFPTPILTIKNAKFCNAIYERLQRAPDYSSEYITLVYENGRSERFRQALSIAREWISFKERLSGVVKESVWTRDIDHIRRPLIKGSGSLFSRVFGKYRAASRELELYLKTELPKTARDRLDLLERMLEGQRKKSLFDEEIDYLKHSVGEQWQGERTPFNEIADVCYWMDQATEELTAFSSEKLKELVTWDGAQLFDGSDFEAKKNSLLGAIQSVQTRLGIPELESQPLENLSLLELKDRMAQMLVNTESYTHWTQYQFAKTNLLRYPCENLLDMIEEGVVSLDSAKDELAYAIAEARWTHARQVKAELGELAHKNRHKLVADFVSFEEARTTQVKTLILEQHLAQVPKGSAGAMGLVRGEIAKKRNHKPIRQVITGASEMIQRIKPIFLMSPISVAQFLPPGTVEFDLLVIDEASQVKPEDALGSIARAKQIVVVGDQKQLPPTSFFDRLMDGSESEEDEAIGAKATEMESILSLCEARGLNQSMLEWHYRSRDPSLIAVSNQEFYNNKLVLPPCPTERDESFGLKLVRVPGVYATAARANGRPATNRIEAEAIADRLKELAIDQPNFSVGVVTFSKNQADMVTEVLELRRRSDAVLDAFLREDMAENVFVKNIENVQGDERDIILISVGYGPHEPNGPLPSMNFGPINSEGGERRLNVLFSRSRIACEVYASFDPLEIDLRRASKEGPAILKRFMEFAKTGELKATYISEGESESPLEKDVAETIRALGYEVDHQVGTAGFKIDLGVKDRVNPQHYMLAVECDGATYHSALWARERDRMRQQILEGFGWHFHRIWSTDWFYQRKLEIDRLRIALEAAGSRDVSKWLKGSNQDQGLVFESGPVEESDAIVLPEPTISVPRYEKSNIVLESSYEPHERPFHEVVKLLCRIVEIEGPVHTEEIARRYAVAHGKVKVGSRIASYVNSALAQTERDGVLKKRGEFWGTEQQFLDVPVRDRSNEAIPTTSAQNIPPMEIVACAQLIERESGLVEKEELVRVIAKTLGFKRAGPDFQSHVRASLEEWRKSIR